LQAKKEEEVKISIGWYLFWFAIVGAVTIFSAWMIWNEVKKGDISSTNSLFKVLSSLMVIGIAMKMTMDFIKSIKGMKRPKWRYMSLIRCLKCDFKSEVQFKEGEYVGKMWDKPCPSCGGLIIIDVIYAKPPEERRSLI